ncbi:MAG: hypothetical protein KME29_05560 [Calothrix sp. FI2-JRJ7]|jgi:acyl transferase domain-containing protein/3-hydroxymyristoyl/3-hydroxydecanoyl-(acyl carrier protein) dehydratase|nr:hypothetical protein [Calothrix sp. FI2-JRJ7]
MDKIAIVGIGCLFPGAKKPDEFWKNLMAGMDFTHEMTVEDIGTDPSIYHNPQLGTPDKISYTKNGYIRDFDFDANGYKISPEKLMTLDKIFHWSLYAAKEALKDSGYFNSEEVLKKTGLILGNLSFPTESSSKLFSSIHLEALEYFVKELLNNQNFSFEGRASLPDISLDNAMTAGLPANIICNGLGLGGITYTIDAACASSLYVMELASYYLKTGQVDMMLAGAVCSPERLFITHGFNVLHAFPGQGNCLPFDKSSEGIKMGEGASLFVLKRLTDAEKAGDHIYAVIENIGLSNDGGGKHILSPSSKGQYLALERAYGQSSPADYIECHATGTPLGDQTELDSLEKFFADKAKIPMLGANKAHIGHMLTVSGMASIIKVIWAMKEGVIPASIGIKNASESQHKIIGSANIIQKHTPWPQNELKRAGINAFGFGGTNAHLILTEYIPQTIKPTPNVPSQTKESTLAIVGMHIHIGSVEGLDAFAQVLSDGRDVTTSLPAERWVGAEESLKEPAPKAAYLEKFDFNCAAFKFPPSEIKLSVFDHLFMMKVADAALRDAGFTHEEHFRKTAVIIACEMNLMTHRTVTRLNIPWYLQQTFEKFNIQLTDDQASKLESILKESISPDFYVEGITGGIGNLAASRISALQNFTGPAFSVSSQENSVYKAIAVARFLLELGHVDAVVVGSIDQAGVWEHVQWRQKVGKHNSDLTFGEGAGAIVLCRKETAQKNKNRIYATIESLAIVQGHEVEASGVCQAAKGALADAKITPKEVAYLEVSQNGIAAQDSNEIAGLSQVYSLEQTQIGSVKTNVGNSFVLSAMASIIKSSLCLYHHFFPGVPIQPNELWESLDRKHKRCIAVNGMSNDSSIAHLILSSAHHWELKQSNRTTEPKTNKSKAVVKTLLNGMPRMRDIILSEDNIKQFSQVSLPLVTQMVTQIPPRLLNNKQFMIENQLTANAKLQHLFLQIQDEFYQQLNRNLTNDTLLTPTLTTVTNIEPKSIVWNLEQITEMVEGKISNVLGDYYEPMDDYPIRSRTPLPPFMFVSRVTKMTAQRGKLEPCTIEWEYDIPSDSFYAAHNVLTSLIPFEASHVMLLALAYTGCDMMFEGKLRYRAIDSQVICFNELPPPGETLRGEVSITNMVNTKKNLLLQYEYNCYYKDKHLMRITANSGYFSEADLNNSKGVPTFTVPKGKTIVKEHFSPRLTCNKTQFSDADIQALQKGDFSHCFGNAYLTKKPLPLGSDKLLMLNRILQLDSQGGLWGLGQIIGEVDIDPDHWTFKAHFKNDPVLPGTMLVEGCNQVLAFYMYYLGLHTKFENFKFAFCYGLKSTAKLRGQVNQSTNKVQFRITVKEINDANDPYIVAVAEIIVNQKVIGILDDLGVRFTSFNPSSL